MRREAKKGKIEEWLHLKIYPFILKVASCCFESIVILLFIFLIVAEHFLQGDK